MVLMLVYLVHQNFIQILKTTKNFLYYIHITLNANISTKINKNKNTTCLVHIKSNLSFPIQNIHKLV